MGSLVMIGLALSQAEPKAAEYKRWLNRPLSAMTPEERGVASAALDRLVEEHDREAKLWSEVTHVALACPSDGVRVLIQFERDRSRPALEPVTLHYFDHRLERTGRTSFVMASRHHVAGVKLVLRGGQCRGMVVSTYRERYATLDELRRGMPDREPPLESHFMVVDGRLFFSHQSQGRAAKLYFDCGPPLGSDKADNTVYRQEVILSRLFDSDSLEEQLLARRVVLDAFAWKKVSQGVPSTAEQARLAAAFWKASALPGAKRLRETSEVIRQLDQRLDAAIDWARAKPGCKTAAAATASGGRTAPRDRGRSAPSPPPRGRGPG